MFLYKLKHRFIDLHIDAMKGKILVENINQKQIINQPKIHGIKPPHSLHSH